MKRSSLSEAMTLPLTIIEKDPRGGDRFIIIGVIDDRARGSCVGRGSAGGSNPWMTAARSRHVNDPSALQIDQD